MKKILLVLCILGMYKISNAQNVFPSSGPVYIGTPAVYNGIINSAEGIFLNTDYNGSNGPGRPIVFGTGRASFSGGTEYMRIESSGNVGIGTASPTTKLDVNGGLRLRQTGHTPYTGSLIEMSDRMENWAMGLQWNSYYDGSWKYRNADYAGFWGMNADGDFILTTSPLGTVNASLAYNERLRITNNGNVGIGTTVPGSYKLAVNGHIRAKEIKVETGWSDFVFEPDYKLLSLKETEDYIKKNRHLPEIPSAKEVEKEGINVGEMNAKLLQKIEELTLHLIEQNKNIDNLRSEITQLKLNRKP